MLKPTPQSMPMGILLRAREFVRGWLTRGHERSLEAKKNILASFVIKGFSISISLLMVPLTINYVNPTQYGIWLTLSSIVAWFSFFDVGFGNGLRNRFAEAKALGNLEKARTYVSTTYAVLTMIFSGVWLIFVAGNQFIDWSKVLNAPADLKAGIVHSGAHRFHLFLPADRSPDHQHGSHCRPETCAIGRVRYDRPVPDLGRCLHPHQSE